eukprot:1134175-Pyramimonas_sp.AAC.1
MPTPPANETRGKGMRLSCKPTQRVPPTKQEVGGVRMPWLQGKCIRRKLESAVNAKMATRERRKRASCATRVVQAPGCYWSPAWNILSHCQFIGRPHGIFSVVVNLLVARMSWARAE